MSFYTDIRDGVYAWTNRSDLVLETDTAIRQALRAAHRSGTFYRDLVILNLTAQPTDQIQVIDLASVAPNYKQISYVKPTGYDLHYTPIDILDLFDQDKVYRTDVFYGVGTSLMIRAASASTAITICYYKSPVVSPLSAIDSWIADMHQDLIILWAAATVLSFIGEQEIKSRVDALARLAVTDLIADSLTIVRR